MTSKTFVEICRLAREGYCDAEIGRRVGEDHAKVRYWRIKAGIPAGERNRGHFPSVKIYTFYNRRTSEYLCEGTVNQCAAALGLSPRTVYSVISRVRNGIQTKYEVHEVEE